MKGDSVKIEQVVEKLKRFVEDGKRAENALEILSPYPNEPREAAPQKRKRGRPPKQSKKEAKPRKERDPDLPARIRAYAIEHTDLGAAQIRDHLKLDLSPEAIRLVLVNKTAHDPEYDPSAWTGPTSRRNQGSKA
jgi:hypothetical protein